MGKKIRGSEWTSNLPEDTELLFPCSVVQPGVSTKPMKLQNPLSFHQVMCSMCLLIVFTAGSFINVHEATIS